MLFNNMSGPQQLNAILSRPPPPVVKVLTPEQASIVRWLSHGISQEATAIAIASRVKDPKSALLMFHGNIASILIANGIESVQQAFSQVSDAESPDDVQIAARNYFYELATEVFIRGAFMVLSDNDFFAASVVTPGTELALPAGVIGAMQLASTEHTSPSAPRHHDVTTIALVRGSLDTVQQDHTLKMTIDKAIVLVRSLHSEGHEEQALTMLKGLKERALGISAQTLRFETIKNLAKAMIDLGQDKDAIDLCLTIKQVDSSSASDVVFDLAALLYTARHSTGDYHFSSAGSLLYGTCYEYVCRIKAPLSRIDALGKLAKKSLESSLLIPCLRGILAHATKEGYEPWLIQEGRTYAMAWSIILQVQDLMAASSNNTDLRQIHSFMIRFLRHAINGNQSLDNESSVIRFLTENRGNIAPNVFRGIVESAQQQLSYVDVHDTGRKATKERVTKIYIDLLATLPK